eukprot:TRINITY_DN90_c0_g1_i3.p1 TRINITY_DN90_c0_g1~~TRINITY_DN90_c0_g1_i3.p1  ORF type:complete len:1113 (+),score=446.88 TRINITY_DN90_c0_g1_i3:1211-4549(+)
MRDASKGNMHVNLSSSTPVTPDETMSPRLRTQTMESREQVGDYILIDKLGKGAYGVVYKALNLYEGNTVAIKQLNLKGASKETIESLEAEITLLKSLDHHNIVRYIGHVSKGKELCIVMEYIENGSLATMVKKYGRFPEMLSKTYIRKVLTGLDYLHEQGVIHRDIKPDNILITKDGEVKLADFGVSTKLNSLTVKTSDNKQQDDAMPAGTPYYMAPEVIEFYGAKPESDVWSLGCTLIELLKGEPPYFSCDPFSAMYKMVEDEHPPLPLGISLVLNDFFMLCFKKDVNMRVSAKELLKHAWLKGDKPNTDIKNAIGEIQEYKTKLQKEINKLQHNDSDADISAEKSNLMERSHTLTQEMKNQMKNKKVLQRKDTEIIAKPPVAKPPVKAEKKPKAAAKSPVKKPAKDEDEDWDMDLGITEEKPLKLKLGDFGDNLELPSVQSLRFDFDNLPDEKNFTLSGLKLASNALKGNALTAWADDSGKDDLDWGDDDDSGGLAAAPGLAALEQPQPRVLNDFVEKDEDDDDFMGDMKLKGDIGSALASRLDNKTEEWEEELKIDEEEVQDEKSALREKAEETLLSEIKELVQTMKPNQDEEKIKKACIQLMDIFNKNPRMEVHLITNHGILPLIIMLGVQNAAVLNSILRLITQIIESNEILVNLCVMGVIPAIMSCSDTKNHTLLTRLYCAYFVQRVISTPETLQMFVACRGLSLLVDFLEDDYEKSRELVHLSVDCIASIFKTQGQTATPKNEFFHLFLNFGLLERLSATLLNIIKSDSHKDDSDDGFGEEDDEKNYSEKVTKIFKVFSMGDSDVKLRICSKNVVTSLKESLQLMDPKSKETLSLLNTIRNISFDRLTLNYLAVFIVPLLNIGLKFVKEQEFQKEIFNQVTHALFHLCRKNRPRQETAAKAGLIPFLVFVIENNKPLKEFAVPLMCELAGSSQVTRKILLENNGLQFYLDLLKDNKTTFHTDALEAVGVCIENEKSKVEGIVAKTEHLTTIKDIFANAPDHQLVELLESILKILTSSTLINKELGSNNKEGGFVSVLKNKLHHPNPHARVTLLRSLNAMVNKYHDPPRFLKQNNLLKVVKFMAANDSSNLVKNMAFQLLKDGGQV